MVTGLKLPIATTPVQWHDWRWQLAHMLTTADELAARIALGDEERAGLAASAQLFRVGVTPYYASLMDPVRASCPIRMQVIPRPQEAEIRDEAPRSARRGQPQSRAIGGPQEYPDRVLFLVVDRCGIYCRHCNRRRLVGGDEPPTTAELEAGLDYIARTRRIRDVLLSGGDPLLLSTRRLDYLLGRLRAIPHVETIRIGTRLPVVCPMRIDDELCAALRKHHPLFINTHFNHIKELTPEAREACARLVDAGIPVGNQTVLLRGVNSSVRSLRALMRGLLRARVRPYYLFQGDTVIGTDHLRTPIETAQELYRGLRGYLNGMAVPMLVLDAPGGGGKVPIVPRATSTSSTPSAPSSRRVSRHAHRISAAPRTRLHRPVRRRLLPPTSRPTTTPKARETGGGTWPASPASSAFTAPRSCRSSPRGVTRCTPAG